MTPDAIHDPHWACRNLWAATVEAGKPTLIEFRAVNPYPEAAQFELLIRPVVGEVLRALAPEANGAEPAQGLAARFVLVDTRERNNRDEEGRRSIHRRLTLEGNEQREMHLTFTMIEQLREDQFAAFEVLQYRGIEPVGGLGVIIQSPR